MYPDAVIGRPVEAEMITDAKEIWNYGKRGSGYGKRPIWGIFKRIWTG